MLEVDGCGDDCDGYVSRSVGEFSTLSSSPCCALELKNTFAVSTIRPVRATNLWNLERCQS